MTDIVRVGPAPVSELARERRVRMRDGVQLATDVYLPDGDESPGDTILIRLPYDKCGPYTFIPLVAEYFMEHGYRVVAQDVRGKFRSDGEALLFVNEARDGYDTIDWIVQQGWSNGSVAMWGDSYYGYTQWAAVSTQHPALKAIAPRVTGTQLGEPVRDPGAIRPVEWAVTYLYPLTYFHSQDGFAWELDSSRRPYSAQAEEVMSAIGARSISYDQWFPSAVHLPRFVDGSPFDARPVPVLHTIGLWDNCAPLSWADVAELESRPAWALNHYLRIEAMDHESYYFEDGPERRTESRTDDQIRSELPRMLDPSIAFFEVFVRGNGRPDDIPRVAWSLAGTPGMRVAERWPPSGLREWVVYAAADGSLGVAQAEESVVEWVHDPDDLVPSSAANAFGFLMERPDEAPLGERHDVVVFTAGAQATPVDLVGPARARVEVQSDGPVMDVFVRLLDVAPDGSALRIARGQAQVNRPPIVGPTEVTIDLGQVSYRLAPGHQLRVHVSSSDHPEYLAQPGTGEHPWSARETRVNRQRLTVGGPHGLELTLSVLDTKGTAS
ncbi:CocE/NonD family hydrolase [Microcella alkalica]|uniref:Xaa-Pro dipeptidyl-peptidase C-terminal domain-containing protein n=1 Tax=Microcella alkalica TaxID=355930 RepID=A0A839E7T5_9MICO|nr:hypothetical protein [Microcella alkalica]